MAKYRKKPVAVNAMQFRPRARTWAPHVFQSGTNRAGKTQAWVRTAHGDVPIEPGDWICWQRVNRKVDAWPVDPDIFAATYEQV